jgi:hypothetical protein
MRNWVVVGVLSVLLSSGVSSSAAELIWTGTIDAATSWENIGTIASPVLPTGTFEADATYDQNTGLVSTLLFTINGHPYGPYWNSISPNRAFVSKSGALDATHSFVSEELAELYLPVTGVGDFHDCYASYYCYNIGLDVQTVSDSPIADAVPEPQSWAFLIAGFLTVGAMLRMRRRIAV